MLWKACEEACVLGEGVLSKKLINVRTKQAPVSAGV